MRSLEARRDRVVHGLQDQMPTTTADVRVTVELESAVLEPSRTITVSPPEPYDTSARYDQRLLQLRARAAVVVKELVCALSVR